MCYEIRVKIMTFHMKITMTLCFIKQNLQNIEHFKMSVLN